MTEDTMSYMTTTFLTLPETIDLSRVSKMFNHIVQHRIKIRAPEILRLQRIMRGWYRVRKRKRPRCNSWARKMYHPDERYLF